MQRRGLISVLSAAVLVLGACGDDAGDAASDAGVEIDDAWARQSVSGQNRGAVYFDLTVDDDDVLLAASVPSDVAATAEVHEVLPADMDADMGTDEMDDMSGETGSDDMDMSDDGEMSGDEMADDSHDMGDGEMAMVMREMTDGLSLTAGETVAFEPGSYHVMLLDLADALDVGEEFEVTLEFEQAGTVTVTVPVLETAP